MTDMSSKKELTSVFEHTPLGHQPRHFDGGHLEVQIARFPKENGSRARTVVITQGKDPTVIAFNGKVRGSRRKHGAAWAVSSP